MDRYIWHLINLFLCNVWRDRVAPLMPLVSNCNIYQLDPAKPKTNDKLSPSRRHAPPPDVRQRPSLASLPSQPICHLHNQLKQDEANIFVRNPALTGGLPQAFFRICDEMDKGSDRRPAGISSRFRSVGTRTGEGEAASHTISWR